MDEPTGADDAEVSSVAEEQLTTKEEVLRVEALDCKNSISLFLF